MGAVVVVIVWWLDLQLPVQSVPITTKVVDSNPVHGEVYSIKHHVIKLVCDLPQVGSSQVSSTNKTDSHDITAILLNVELSTITLTITLKIQCISSLNGLSLLVLKRLVKSKRGTKIWNSISSQKRALKEQTGCIYYGMYWEQLYRFKEIHVLFKGKSNLPPQTNKDSFQEVNYNN